jgi:hypothetical protein
MVMEGAAGGVKVRSSIAAFLRAPSIYHAVHRLNVDGGNGRGRAYGKRALHVYLLPLPYSFKI